MRRLSIIAILAAEVLAAFADPVELEPIVPWEPAKREAPYAPLTQGAPKPQSPPPSFFPRKPEYG